MGNANVLSETFFLKKVVKMKEVKKRFKFSDATAGFGHNQPGKETQNGTSQRCT